MPLYHWWNKREPGSSNLRLFSEESILLGTGSDEVRQWSCGWLAGYHVTEIFRSMRWYQAFLYRFSLVKVSWITSSMKRIQILVSLHLRRLQFTAVLTLQSLYLKARLNKKTEQDLNSVWAEWLWSTIMLFIELWCTDIQRKESQDMCKYSVKLPWSAAFSTTDSRAFTSCSSSLIQPYPLSPSTSIPFPAQW